MASYPKILGQSNPAATTSTDLYTVPAGTAAKVKSITMANVSGSAITVRLSFAVAGEALATKQYHLYGLSIPANDAYEWTGEKMMAATDVIRVYASDTNLAVTATGEEIV